MEVEEEDSFVFSLNKSSFSQVPCEDSKFFINNQNTFWSVVVLRKQAIIGSLLLTETSALNCDISNFCWLPCGQYGSPSRCLLITSNGEIQIRQVQHVDGQITCTVDTEYSQDTVRDVLEEKGIDVVHWPDSVHVVHTSDNTCTLLIHNHVLGLDLSAASFAQPQVTFCSIIEPLQNVTNVQLCQDLFVVYDASLQQIFFVSYNGTHLSTVHLQKLRTVSSLSNLTHWSVSDNLSHLALFFSNLQLQVVPLNTYFNAFPRDIIESELEQDSGSKCGHWISQCENLLDKFARNASFDVDTGKTKSLRKPRSKVSGFTSGSKSKDVFRTHVTDLGDMGYSECTDMSCEEDVIYLCLKSTRDKRTVVAVNRRTGKIKCQSVPVESTVLLPKKTPGCLDPLSPLVLSSLGLHAVAFNTRQEQLVNKLMLYSSPSVADRLCRLNQWDQCSIPIHTLEVGLKHRQLDTVAFFLRSHEHVFSGKQRLSEPITPSSSPTSASAAVRPKSPLPSKTPDLDYSDLDLIHLDTAIELLKKTIRLNIADSLAKQFAEQLLHVTMDHLHKVIKNIVARLQNVQLGGHSTETFERKTEAVLTKLTDHIMDLRSYVRDMPSRLKKSNEEVKKPVSSKLVYDVVDVAVEVDEDIDQEDIGVKRRKRGQGSLLRNLTEQQKTEITIWDSLNEKAAIVEGLLHRDVPLLQAYLKQRFGVSSAAVSHIIKIGLEEVLAYLQEKEMKYAQTLLRHMGFDPISKLRQICLFTADRDLRDYLIGFLQGEGHFSQQEVEMVSFLRQLESSYSCRSFEVAKLLRTEGKLRWNDPLHFERSSPESGSDISSSSNVLTVAQSAPDSTYGSSEDSPSAPAIALSAPASSTAAPHSELPALAISPTTPAIDLCIHCGDLEECDVDNSENSAYSHVLLEWLRVWDPETRARVLLEQAIYRRDSQAAGNMPSLIIWQYLCDHLDRARLRQWIEMQFSSAASTSIPSKVSWPYNLPITQEMVDATERSTQYLKEEVYNMLATHGVFSSSENSDMSLLLRRLSKIGSVMTTPHPLESRHNTGPSLTQLHEYVIQRSIEKKWAQFLYDYLDYWGLCETIFDLGDVGQGQAELPAWVDFMLHCRATSRMLQDPQYVFEASLSNSRFLCADSDLLAVSVESMLQQGLVGRAVATVMYSQNALGQLISNEDDKLRSALSDFPRLQHALFPPAQEESLPQDITVYNLLQSNIPFDVSMLFGWQDSNTLKNEDTLFQELPHFSNADLVARFGRENQLGFRYYLRQGRPAMALCTLLTSLIIKGHRSLTHRIVSRVSHVAQTVGLRHYHNPSIASACSAFIEMLGGAATSLRVHLEVANRCHAFKLSQLTGTYEQKKEGEVEVRRYMRLLVQSCSHGRVRSVLELKTLLIEATRWDIVKHRIKSWSFEASQRWCPVYLFCILHKLPFPTDFLQNCAKADDWLMLLAHSQMHQIPADQIKPVLGGFPSSHLREHLLLVLDNMADSAESTSVKTASAVPAKNVRAQLYSKIGVHKSTEQLDSTSCVDTDDDLASDMDLPPDTHQHQLLPNEEQITDIFGIILACLDQPKPAESFLNCAVKYRHPALAVLAACQMEKVDTMSCMCAWLLASLPSFSHQKLTDGCHGDMWTKVPFGNIVDEFIETNSMQSLRKALDIFLPDSPLLVFLDFYVTFINMEPNSAGILTNFVIIMAKARPSEEDPDILPLNSFTWTEVKVVKIISQHLSNATRDFIGQFLEVINKSELLKHLTCKCPNIPLILQLHQIIASLDQVQLNYTSLQNQDHPGYIPECSRVIDLLQDNAKFSEAREFAKLTDMKSDDITVRQLKCEKSQLQSSAVWQQASTRQDYMHRCQTLLQAHHVSPVVAAKFFKEEADSRTCANEKSDLYQEAYHWLSQSEAAAGNGKDNREQLFINIWKSKIEDFKEHKTIPKSKKSGKHIDKNEFLLEKLQSLPTVTETTKLNSEDEDALNMLLGDLLLHGRVFDTCVVARHFSHENTELALLLSCLQLAHGVLQPSSLPNDHKKLLAAPSRGLPRRPSASYVSFPRLGSSVSIASMAQQTEDNVDGEEDENLAALLVLSQHATVARKCVTCIVCLYRMSKILGISFGDVLLLEDFQLLSQLLSCAHPQRHAFAKSYIQASGTEDAPLAGFLCDAILEALQMHAGVLNRASSSQGRQERKPLLMRSESGFHTTGVQELIQLCEKPAVLGQRLSDAAVSLATSNRELSTKILGIEVELLIYAHDCHTLACHMEGISDVLRVAHKVMDDLARAEEWNIMIRLLTGVGRFSEMTYIFDILKQNHQFEMLFRKGIDREDKLKLAVLDYLSRYHPEDMDAFTMVSLHFTMYREIAHMLQAAANKQLTALTGKQLDNSIEINQILNNCLHYYSDAAENFVKEQCLRHAQVCVRQAKLIALQLHLLPQHRHVNVIRLMPDAVRAFLLTHNNMHQSLIVSEAYGTPSVWAEALFNLVIKQGDMKYLADFHNHMTVTKDMLLEIADRYLALSSPTPAMGSHMRKLLSHSSDLITVYTLANRLGFTTMAKDMLKTDGASYLRDANVVLS